MGGLKVTLHSLLTFLVINSLLSLLWSSVNIHTCQTDNGYQTTCNFQVLRGERETVGAACWGHSPWLRMSVRDGAATMATIAGGGGGGNGPANLNDHDDRSYLLQIYPRLNAQPSTCCNLRWVFHNVTAKELVLLCSSKTNCVYYFIKNSKI